MQSKNSKKTTLKRVRKEDLILCPDCKKAFIDTGRPDATIIIKNNCPECNSKRLVWAKPT